MLSILATLLAPLALLLLGAKADHAVCSWTGPGQGDPTQYSWEKYCIANPKVMLVPNGDNGYDSKAKFKCNDSETQVADWNYLGNDNSGRLEFATPCNGNGFADNPYIHWCNFIWWSACISDNANFTGGKIQCFYMNKYDDCEWPTKFATSKELPASVGIFYGPHWDKRSVTVRKDH